MRYRKLFSSVRVEFRLKFLGFFQQLGKFFPEIRQPVFNSWRDFTELNTLKNSCSGQMAQAVIQYFIADAFDVTFQSAGAANAAGHSPQDADRPPAADDVLQ